MPIARRRHHLPTPAEYCAALCSGPPSGTCPAVLRSRPPQRRPEHTQYAEMSRWLVHSTSWGTLSVIDRETGAPVG